MSLKLDIPTEIMAVLTALRDAGGRPLLVGGAVRDALLGVPAADFDVATSLPPEEIATVCSKRSFAMRFGGVDLELGGAGLTITTFREDGAYTDQRHPESVTFVPSPERDAPRRDFTVNAVYCDPWTGAITDPCGGVADIESRTLRAIGDPVERLREDPLRILRAIRFAARDGLHVQTATRAAIERLRAETDTLSRERVFDELTNLFSGRGRGRGLRLLVETRVAEHVLPEVMAMPGVAQPPEYHPEGDVFVHTCLVLEHVLPGDPVQAWAAVLHDVAKPLTFERAEDRIRFHGHDARSAEMADAILRRFRAPRELRETVVEVCRDHIRIAALPRMKPRRRERWMRSPRFAAHLEFHRADCMGSHGKLDIYHAARAAWEALPPEPPPPLCSGADVLALGVPAGPRVGEILRRLDDELAQRGVSDRDSALLELRRIVESFFRPRQ